MNKLNVTELYREFNVPTIEGHQHNTAGWIQTDCPWCGEGSRRYHLGYNPTSGVFNCWRCGPVKFWPTLSALTRQPVAGLRPLLAPRSRASVAPVPTVRGSYKPPSGLVGLLPAHKRYLQERGFGKATARQWGLQGLGAGGPLQWRIFIPITFDGVPVSWTTRAIGDVEPRYRSAAATQESIPRSRLLYGEDDTDPTTVVICEGPTDAWAIGPGAVATLGVRISTDQINRLSRWARRVICFDNEPRAQVRARKLARLLSVLHGQTEVITLESGSDPATADRQEIEAIRETYL